MNSDDILKLWQTIDALPEDKAKLALFGLVIQTQGETLELVPPQLSQEQEKELWYLRSLKEDSMSYQIAVTCGNCGYSGLVEIKDGEPIGAQKCPTCKCQGLMRQPGSSATRKS